MHLYRFYRVYLEVPFDCLLAVSSRMFASTLPCVAIGLCRP